MSLGGISVSRGLESLGGTSVSRGLESLGGTSVSWDLESLGGTSVSRGLESLGGTKEKGSRFKTPRVLVLHWSRSNTKCTQNATD